MKSTINYNNLNIQVEGEASDLSTFVHRLATVDSNMRNITPKSEHNKNNLVKPRWTKSEIRLIKERLNNLKGRHLRAAAKELLPIIGHSTIGGILHQYYKANRGGPRRPYTKGPVWTSAEREDLKSVIKKGIEKTPFRATLDEIATNYKNEYNSFRSHNSIFKKISKILYTDKDIPEWFERGNQAQINEAM